MKDVEFSRGHLTVRDPKQKHDRMAMLPSAVTAEPREQIVQRGPDLQQLLWQPWRLRTMISPTSLRHGVP